MTNEELCKEIRLGRRELLNELIRQNKGMIHKVAQHYGPAAARNRGLGTEDLVQAVTLGMILSVDTWEESRGAFLTYALFYMRREARAALGMESTKRRIENVCPPASVDEPLMDAEDCTLLDSLADPNAVCPDEACKLTDMRGIVRREVACLPEMEREAVVGRYFGGSSPVDQKELRRGIRSLGRNKALLNLMIEYCDPCYRHKSLGRFNTEFSSVVEDAVIRRERLLADIDARIAGGSNDRI